MKSIQFIYEDTEIHFLFNKSNDLRESIELWLEKIVNQVNLEK